MTTAQSKIINNCTKLLTERINMMQAILQVVRNNNDHPLTTFLAALKGEAECVRNNANTIIGTLAEAGVKSAYEEGGVE